MLKFLIIVICIFFILRIFSRMFVVSSFNAMNKKMKDEMNKRQGGADAKMPEGHITIDPGAQKQKRKDDDDYVDFEEVK